MCERPVDGFSWSPPGPALQADTMRKLVVLEDVVLKSASPVLLPAGASGRPPSNVWWPTQTNRQGDGGPLGPLVVEQGGVQSTDEDERLLTKRQALHCGKQLVWEWKAETNIFS